MGKKGMGKILLLIQFHFKPRKDILIIFCCDPNDINVITYKEIKDLC